MRYTGKMKTPVIGPVSQLFLYFATLAILGSVVLSLPLCYSTSQLPPYLDRLFTAVSALCVTGLSTVNVEIFSITGLIVLMVLIESGGLGLISFFIFYLVLPRKKVTLANRKFARSFFVSGVEADPLKIIRDILIYSGFFQLCGALILGAILYTHNYDYPWFTGLFTAVSAFCNAGFTPWGTSLISVNHNAGYLVTVMVLILLGGLGFTVMQDVNGWLYSRMRHKQMRRIRLSLHSKIVLCATVVLVFFPGVLFLLIEWNHAFSDLPLGAKVSNALFQSVTCRTAGFEAVSQSRFTNASTLLSELLMLIGGNPGSMAGGIKTTTVFIALCTAFRTEEDTGALSIFRRDIPFADTEKALSVIVKAALFLLVMTLIIFMVEQSQLESGVFSTTDLIFETISALGTTGLSRGITADLLPVTKMLLILTMYAGRTGVITLTMRVAFVEQKIKASTEFPQESVLIG